MSKRVRGPSRSFVIATRSYILRNIRELNLFSNDPFWSSALNDSEQILSTRFFLLFLLVSLLIVITYTSLIIRTHSTSLEKFSLADFEQLEARYPTTINVPCTQVSNPYHKFIQLSAKFHQICSSPFIGDKWISSLFLHNVTYHNPLDFRTFIFAQFQALALLCQTAYQSAQDGYYTFNNTHLVTGHVLSRAEFNEIFNVLTSNFQNNLVENANRTAKAVLVGIAQNGLMSALRTDSYIESVYPSGRFVIYSEYYLMKNGTPLCNCRLQENQCTHPVSVFYNSTLFDSEKMVKLSSSNRFQIPGLMAGCLPVESIRQSTLECLYDQSCIYMLSFQTNISRPRPLEISSSKFPPNMTIGSMFDESLFIESWQSTFSFEDYFSVCAPRSLTYTYQGRFRLPIIFTICVSAFGGLVIIWQLITPAVVKILTLVKWRKQQRQATILPDQMSTEQTTVTMSPQSIRKAVTSCIHRTIYNFNLFPPDDENDIEEQKSGIITTRLYILFLLCGLVILGFYTCFMKRTQTYTVSSPSLFQFEELNFLYESTLVCPCSRLSMSYRRVMSISPRYHPICSSEFITRSWMSYFDLKQVNSTSIFFFGADFRMSGQSFFSIMRDLCQTAKESVDNAIRSFLSRRLVTVNILPDTTFDRVTKTRLTRFEQETVASFINLPLLLRSAFHTNHLVTNLLTSAHFSIIYDNQTSKWAPGFSSQTMYNNSCSCAFSSQCVRPQGFYLRYDGDDLDLKIIIPGLVLGCYTIDSLLLSTLQCLYQKQCLKLLIDMYDFDAVGYLRPLDIHTTRIQPLSKENSRFSPNTTMEYIVSQLFIEDWGTLTNFTGYYEKCAPKQCTYSIARRFDRTYIFAIMLGFYSGLGVILENTLPYFVRFIRRRWIKRQRNKDNLEITENRNDSSRQNTNSCSFCQTCQSFRSLNLFASKRSAIDEQRKRADIIATRVYLILFVLSLIAALLYAGPFSNETKTTSIKFPTADNVNDLHAKNISTLSCPCSVASIRHSKFISMIPQYHAICFSDYVKPSYWIGLLQHENQISKQLGTHYSVLASLCEQAHRIIKNAEDNFDTRELVGAETMAYSTFTIQTEAFISTFISQILADYRRILTFIIRSFGVNHLLNVFTNNWKLGFTDEDKKYIVATYPRRFASSNCTCATSFDCTEQVQENIVSGCFPFDGFRLSKYQNISLGQLNDRLFIEKWKNKSNYTAYFEECRPFQCQYTLPDRNNPMNMFATILGLCGGLTYALRLIVGQSLHAYLWWSKHKKETSSID